MSFPIYATGSTAPISLFTYMMETRIVSSQMASRRASRDTNPVLIHRKIGDPEALLLQEAHGIIDGRMLDAGGDQMVSLSSGSHGGANEGHIVGLRSAGGKNDLLFLYLQRACDLLRASRMYRSASTPFICLEEVLP